MFHYCYSIRYADRPNVYFGVRSCKCSPEKDNYWGSPKTFKAWMDDHKDTRIKTILATYPSREEAELAEDELIERQWEINKPLSLNAGIRGAKFNVVGREKTQKQIEAARKAFSKSFYLVSPQGQVFQGQNLKQFCEDNYLDCPHCWSVMKGGKLHSKGWTSSLAAHQLYLEAYTDRGISWDNHNKIWVVNWNENKVKLSKRFKSEYDAIAYRDSLVDAGYEFLVKTVGWKERLTNIQLPA